MIVANVGSAFLGNVSLYLKEGNPLESIIQLASKK